MGKVAYGSMIKITLRSEPNDFWVPDEVELNEHGKEFNDTFNDLTPNEDDSPPDNLEDLALLLQKMALKAAQKTLSPVANGGKFVPVSSFYYSDGVGMFTLTGVVCKENEESKLKKAFDGWEFANTEWGAPTQIIVPDLSIKERLTLQPLLPAEKSGATLRKKLGHLIDSDDEKTEKALEQYATFHRYTPYFLKGVP